MATDNFNRSNEQLDADSAWTSAGGDQTYLNIVSNQLAITGNSSLGSGCTFTDTGDADHYLDAVFVAEGHQGNTHYPFCVRMSDRANFMGVRQYFGSYQLQSRVANSFTEEDTVAIDHSANDTIRIECVGDDIEVFINGSSTPDLTYSGTKNNTNTLTGVVGRYNASGSCLVDDWDADVIAAAGTSPKGPLGHPLRGALGGPI